MEPHGAEKDHDDRVEVGALVNVTVYLRVSKDGGRGPKVVASTKPNYEPLKTRAGQWNEKALPTLAFAIELEIPDDAFDTAARVIASLEIPEDATQVAATVTLPEPA